MCKIKSNRLSDYKSDKSLGYGVDINQTNIILGHINRSMVHVGCRKSFSMSGEKPLPDNCVAWTAMVEKNCRQTGNRPKASTKYDKCIGKHDLSGEVEIVCLV